MGEDLPISQKRERERDGMSGFCALVHMGTRRMAFHLRRHGVQVIGFPFLSFKCRYPWTSPLDYLYE